MIGLFERAAEMQAFCDVHRWRFCFIGGLAVQRWGEPRVTRDVNVTLLTGFGDERAFIDVLLQEYEPRRADAAEFALAYRVLLLRFSDGVGLDVALGGLSFEEEVVTRASPFEVLPGIVLRTCSAEDLVVLKAFAGRPIDWQDVRMVLARQGVEQLDWQYIIRNLSPLADAKEDSSIVPHLQSLRDQVQSRASG